MFRIAGIAVLCLVAVSHAADDPLLETWSLRDQTTQQDFPDLTLDSNGTPWLTFIAYDGKSDVLKLARLHDGKIQVVGSLSEAGIVHHPRITADDSNGLWVTWSQLDQVGQWNLYARQINDGRISDTVLTVSKAKGNDINADITVDGSGRVWWTWQVFRSDFSDIVARHYDPKSQAWSKEVSVAASANGDWEPKIALGGKDEVVIAFDSSGAGSFDVKLASVKVKGDVRITDLAKSPAYEARVSIAATPDRSGFWVAWERGRDGWGRDSRGHNANLGLNANKLIDVVYVDGESKDVKPVPSVKSSIVSLLGAAKPRKGGRQRPGIVRVPSSFSVNIPVIGSGPDGAAWLLTRYAQNNGVWHLALNRYDRDTERWSDSVKLPNSSFSQERPARVVCDRQGNMWLAWASDLRTSKRALVSGIELAKIASGKQPAYSDRVAKATGPTKYQVKMGAGTPQRPAREHHAWTFNGKTYKLYFGDFHRHTNFSNCRTITDGSVVEQFRYAIDIGGLDFLGTSDHTDIAKPYDPYEWWENQKLQDLFQVDGFFNSFYVYEREQRWPWGHRNVVFTERGGPIVYINRQRYVSSPWGDKFPVDKAAKGEITPQELWAVLRKTGKRVTVMSHTGATGMGTDWGRYDKIDNAVEQLVEIYQGARVSYEGLNAPQPGVALKPLNAALEAPKSDSKKNPFGPYAAGVYQNCLAKGHRLGVFANSDHISTNTSYGGVYVTEFTRDGILDGIEARRGIAATDEIFLQFSSDGHMLGSTYSTDAQPELSILVGGTAEIARVTVVRNEKDYKVFEPKSKEFQVTFKDESPLDGENRYYVRVEQVDGNMAWGSPIWVQIKK